jgi:hypothetical protein
MYYDAIDANLLGSTIWNYTADNTNAAGDHWNGEDLSIVSRDRDGTLRPRAIAGWRRPYPMASAGTPLEFRWDLRRRTLYFRFLADPDLSAPTEIYVPPGLWETPELSVEPAADAGAPVGTAAGLRAEYKPEADRIYVYNGGYRGEAVLWAGGERI